MPKLVPLLLMLMVAAAGIAAPALAGSPEHFLVNDWGYSDQDDQGDDATDPFERHGYSGQDDDDEDDYGAYGPDDEFVPDEPSDGMRA